MLQVTQGGPSLLPSDTQELAWNASHPPSRSIGGTMPSLAFVYRLGEVSPLSLLFCKVNWPPEDLCRQLRTAAQEALTSIGLGQV